MSCTFLFVGYACRGAHPLRRSGGSQRAGPMEEVRADEPKLASRLRIEERASSKAADGTRHG
jgi:hypothetical protein